MKKIRTEGTNFIDEKGNFVKLRGVNMVCKDKSKHYIGDYREKNFEYLKSLGMNLIRLGIFWDGVEPEPGIYDDDYLSKVDKIIEMASKNEIYVYLDMHQDLYSASFEDGAPQWATITDGFTYTKTELWSDAYLMCPAVQIAFDNFWNNRVAADGVGLQDHYVNMWAHIAKRYADNPYVIGYDVLNEPFPGTKANKVVEVLLGTIAGFLPPEILSQAKSEEEIQGLVLECLSDSQKKAELFEKIGTPENLFKLVSEIEPVTGDFEEAVLNPFYEKMLLEIRKFDPDSIMMLENNYFSNAGIPSHVKPVSVHGTVLKNQVYAPHGYDIFVDTDMYETTDFTRIDMIFESHRMVAQQLQLPVIVGEWGCFPESSPAQLEQVAHLLALFEAMNAGNTYYEFQHLQKKSLAEGLRNKSVE